jgi:hypothetical protein
VKFHPEPEPRPERLPLRSCKGPDGCSSASLESTRRPSGAAGRSPPSSGTAPVLEARLRRRPSARRSAEAGRQIMPHSAVLFPAPTPRTPSALPPPQPRHHRRPVRQQLCPVYLSWFRPTRSEEPHELTGADRHGRSVTDGAPRLHRPAFSRTRSCSSATSGVSASPKSAISRRAGGSRSRSGRASGSGSASPRRPPRPCP